MNILIFDERTGDILRDEDAHIMADADIILNIEPDGLVTIVIQNPVIASIDNEWLATFYEGVHRDVISGEESAASRKKQIDKMVRGDEPGERERAMGKVFDALGTTANKRGEILNGVLHPD